MKGGGFQIPADATVTGVNLAALGIDGPTSQIERKGGQTAKYGNRKVTLDGYLFDSQKEARRYRTLQPLASTGLITEFEVHPVYVLSVNGFKICKFTLDFRYRLEGGLIVEDVKSKATRQKYSYRLKKRLLLALYGIELREV